MQAYRDLDLPQAPAALRQRRETALLMRIVMLLFLLGTLAAIWITRRWPIVHDAPLMHYVIFLMDHGRAPYRDIIEMNMPGSYILQWLVMHAFGGGPIGWWIWDCSSGVAAILAGAWIAGPTRRPAGVAGGALTYLYHLSAGPVNWGQRDWIVAVLFLLAVGCLFQHIRYDKPAWIAGFTFFATWSAMIKPPVLLIALCFLIAACVLFRRMGRRALSMVLWAIAGTVPPSIVLVAFLLRWGVVREFLVMLHGLVPWYASLDRVGYGKLLLAAVPVLWVPLLLSAIVLYVAGRSWHRWEQNFLLAGVVAGVVLFLTQGKGWTYHLGLELSFLSLWVMLEIDRAFVLGRWQQVLAVATALLAVLVALPAELHAIVVRTNYPMEDTIRLEADLNRLGGASLSNNIQCLDMTLGRCIDVLYRMKLVQTTGFIYDFYLFPPQTNASTQPLQAQFLREMSARPPRVIVLSAHIWPGDYHGYQEVANWPAFSTWLGSHYQLDTEFPGTGRDGYRIYTLKKNGPE